jgi:hypothetical protein
MMTAMRPRPDARSAQPAAVRGWLRVRGGLHRGAAVPLHEGAVTIGSSLDDDIVLHDAGVVAAHLLVSAGDGALAVQAREGGWALEGLPVPLNESIRVLSGRNAESVILRLGESAIELSGLGDHDPRREHLRARWIPGQLVRRLGMGRAGAPFVAGTVVIAVGLLWWFVETITPTGARTLASVGPAPAAEIERSLRARSEWTKVALTGTAAVGYELRGRVDRREMLDELVRQPEVARLAPLVRVVVEQDLRRQIRELTGDGAIVVAIEDATPSAQSASASHPAALRAVVSGSTRRAGVKASLDLLSNEWGDRVEIVDRTLYEPDERDRKTVRVELPIRIASVNTAEGYVESSDGRKYFQGSSVQGYLVETIESRKVVFNVAGKRIEFPVP